MRVSGLGPGIRGRGDLGTAPFHGSGDDRRANALVATQSGIPVDLRTVPERAGDHRACDLGAGQRGAGLGFPPHGDRGGRGEEPALRGEHLQREEGRLEQPVAVLRRGEPAAADQRHGQRGRRRSPGLHPHEPPRRRQGAGHRGPACRRHDLSRPRAPVRSGDGPGPGQGRARPAACERSPSATPRT